MDSKTMQDQQVCLDALAVFDDNQNGMEPPIRRSCVVVF
jgi:hypothetical protein